MKLNRKHLRKLIIESMQEQYDARPSEWQEVEALRDVDMDMYEKQLAGDRKTHELTPQERGEMLAKRARWEAELSDEALDEDWVIDAVSDGTQDFDDLIIAVVNDYPGTEDVEGTLLRIIADSEVIHLDDATQTLHF
jgi:hypothetical protein